MKTKKNNEIKKETKSKAADVMQELDENTASQFSGGVGNPGNPFANVARVPTQNIDSKLRNDG